MLRTICDCNIEIGSIAFFYRFFFSAIDCVILLCNCSIVDSQTKASNSKAIVFTIWSCRFISILLSSLLLLFLLLLFFPVILFEIVFSSNSIK